MYQQRSAFAHDIKELFRRAFERKLHLGEDAPLDESFFQELEFYSYVLFDVAQRQGVREETYWRFKGEKRFAKAKRIYGSWSASSIDDAIEAFYSIVQYLGIASVARDGMFSLERYPLRSTLQKEIFNILRNNQGLDGNKTKTPSNVL